MFIKKGPTTVTSNGGTSKTENNKKNSSGSTTPKKKIEKITPQKEEIVPDEDMMISDDENVASEETTKQKQQPSHHKKVNDSLTSILFGGYKSAAKDLSINLFNSSDELNLQKIMTDDELIFGETKAKVSTFNELKSDIEQQDDSDLFYVEKPSIHQNDEMLDEGEVSKKKMKLIKLKPAWEDVYTKELRIANDDDEEEIEEIDQDGITQSLVQGFLKRKRDGQNSSILLGSEYEKKMRKIYTHLFPTPHWAKLKVKQYENENQDGTVSIREEIIDENNLNQTADEILQKSSEKTIVESLNNLDRFKLAYQKLNDINGQERVGQVFSIAFHPNLNIAAVLNSDKKIRIFTVDGELNPILDRLQITNQGDNDLKSIAFTKDGKSIISFLDKSAYFLMTDMDSGKTRRTQKLFSRRRRGDEKEGGKFLLHNAFDVSNDNKLIAVADDIGSVLLISRKTLNIKHTFTSNMTQVSGVTFSEDSKTLFVVGKGGKVYVYDVESEKIKHIFADHGSIHTHSVAVSPDMQYIATGSTSGAVNLYRWADVFNGQAPKPLGTFMNLTTTANYLRFTSDSQLLLFASTEKSNAFRFAHISSLYVYSNFPGEISMKKQYSFNSITLSSSSSFLSLGCQSGPVILFKLPYYANKQ
ncbi:predicted protein [Naegleria gruberi]|uniref:Predicted protein n=1 Tax=Naegleria gruberi TaxID=5762 RepID=D2UYJ7_NAEGR|nr:uncharacterized protein NAEGRDRAFT_45194 [Naegleria gruberi]EFC50486.1 predicted protein [Naegleria gruberi]|eukprot:XP_002683230.1 predicted protein [Naegleria gruberi strain NEG-M]